MEPHTARYIGKLVIIQSQRDIHQRLSVVVMTGATLPWIKTHAYYYNFLANNTNKQQFISMLNAVVTCRRGTVRPTISQVMLIYLQKAVESANTTMTVLIGNDTVRHGFRIFGGRPVPPIVGFWFTPNQDQDQENTFITLYNGKLGRDLTASVAV